MTIICYRDGVMAADSASFSGDIVSAHVRKITRSPTGALIGVSGDTKDVMAFLRWAEQGADLEKCPKKIKICGLIAAGDDAVDMVENGLVYRVSGPFFAVGSAEDFGLGGAMAAGASARSKRCFWRCAIALMLAGRCFRCGLERWIEPR